MRPVFCQRVSVPFVLPQNRHPESRSASPIYRVIQRLWRGVEGPRRCLSSPMLCEAFQPEKPDNRVCCDTHLLHEGHGGPPPLRASVVGKLRTAWGKISTAGVLRLRATSAVLRDKSVRRFAQDDDSVGETNGTETFVREPGRTADPSAALGMTSRGGDLLLGAVRSDGQKEAACPSTTLRFAQDDDFVGV